MTETHPNVVRAAAAIRAAGLDSDVMLLADSARTSAEAAVALGVEVAQIAKSLVFLADGAPVLVVASGSDRVDTARLAAAVGATKVTRADADAVRAATGYPIGGVSPAGLPPDLPVLVDTALSRWDVVWAAAGTPHTVFPTTYAGLLALTGGRPADVAAR